MRAAIQMQYGLDAIEVGDRPIPEPGAGQVRVKVRKASMNPLDWHFARGRPAMVRPVVGWRRPKQEIIGTDMCGVVDALGSGVTGLAVGDVVFGSGMGAFSEYGIAKATRLAPKPASMTPAEAAGLPVAGVTALQAFEGIDLAGKRVVVNGASGGVGHYAIQIAVAQGAEHVAGVCSSRNLGLVEGLGADEAIDYANDDFTSRSYDVLIDCAGRRKLADVKRCLTPGGHWVLVGPEKGGAILGPLPALAALIVRSKFSDISMRNFTASETLERLEALAQMVKDGQLRTHVECEYPLEEVRAAFDHAGTHRSRGKVIVSI